METLTHADAATERLIEALQAADELTARVIVARVQADGWTGAELVGGLILPAFESVAPRASRESGAHRRSEATAAIVCGLLADTVAPLAGRPETELEGDQTDRAGSTNGGGQHTDGANRVGLAAGWAQNVVTEAIRASGWQLAEPGGPAWATLVTAAHVADIPEAARAVRTALEAGVPVLAAGAAFGADGARALRLGAQAWVPSLTQAWPVLARWARSAPPAGAAPAPSDDGLVLDEAWPRVLASAAASGGQDETRVHETLKAVGDHLMAAVLLDEPTVMAEWIDARLAGPHSSPLGEMHLLGLIDAVSAVLPSGAKVAVAIVDGSRAQIRKRVGRPGNESFTNGRQENGTGRSPAELPADTAPGSSMTVANGAGADPRPSQGQGFADLLMLLSLACQATGSVLSVPQPDGRWSPLSYGLEHRDGLTDRALYRVIAGRREPVEIADLPIHPELSRSPLALPPHEMRWVYGTGLHDGDGKVIAVLCVVDRWLRAGTRRDQRALAAAARQLTEMLVALQRPAEGPPPRRPAAVDTVGEPGGQQRPMVGLRRSHNGTEVQHLLRSHEVAVLFDVTERTVINWAASNKLPSLRTIGGHLRFRREDVYRLLDGRPAAS